MTLHRRGRALFLTLFFVAGFALLSGPALAVSPQLSFRELASQAELIVAGRVETLTSSYAEDGLIYTQAWLTVDRLMLGSLGSDHVLVTVPGGVVGDVGLWVSDAPRFSMGDEVLLFLQDESHPGLIGGSHGAFKLRQGRLVGSGLDLDQIQRAIEAHAVDDQGAASLADGLLGKSGAMLEAELSFIWGGIRWAGPGATGEYYVNESGSGASDATAAINAAAQTWSSVPGADFTLSYAGTTWRTSPSQDGWNTVAWKRLGSYPSALAMAYSWYTVPELIIFEADMVINSDYGWSASAACPAGLSDVQNVATHEFGHWAGLKDLSSAADAEKTMYAGSWLGETRKRTLEPDDQDGLRAIYPAPLQVSNPGVIAPGAWGTPGRWHVFTTTYTSDAGWQSIRYADFLVAAAPDSPKAVRARYDVQADRLYLLKPTDGVWFPAGGRVPGEVRRIKHKYGYLDPGQTEVTGSGNELVIRWALLFTWRMSGASHQVHLASEQMSGAVSPWQSFGAWTVNRTPTMAPPELNKAAVPTGNKLIFAPAYKDQDGRETLNEIYFLITNGEPMNGVPIRDSVLVKYDNTTGQMYLRDRYDYAWIPAGGVTPLTKFVIGNGLVKVYGPGSRVINADCKTFRPMWVLEFEAAFRGRHAVYMRAVDSLGGDLGGDTGWKWKGWVEVR